mmetsp:Transcript_10902/g.20741  ORF Transcript_10902/g.20741 Transcript_10902/m.20741 type:complete len:140 (-) Transcript_10902:7-426(-)
MPANLQFDTVIIFHGGLLLTCLLMLWSRQQATPQRAPHNALQKQHHACCTRRDWSEASENTVRFSSSGLFSMALADCSEQQIGLDYPYGDINVTTTVSAEACCDLCSQTADCKLWVWSPKDATGGGAQHCWLKHAINEP